MRNLESKLKNKAINYNKLIKYGFIEDNNLYRYNKKILNNQFEVIIEIDNKEVKSKLIDLNNEDEYILVDMEGSTGEFVGTVRQEYEKVLEDFISKCTDIEIFRCRQTKEIIDYIRKKYNDELEFLWEKFDNTAIWRNKQNNKWYGLICEISENKLGISSEKEVEIIDLRYQKEDIENIIDKKYIFPGYHMNKKSWITIILDDSVKMVKIKELVDNSYNLSIGNKCGLTGNDLSKKVYEYLRKIPKGKVVTYKQVAEYLGNKGLARVVGNILHKNPDGDKNPCYKVVNSKGELAEAFVFGGKNIQKERLEKDGIKLDKDKVDLFKYQWKE